MYRILCKLIENLANSVLSMKKGRLENKEIKVEKRKKRKKDGYKEEVRKNND